jgi:hypothetical protein
MSFWFIRVINYSIFISVIISVFRIKIVDKKYYPFIFYLWLWFSNEVISDIFIYYFKTNALNNNLYLLLFPLILIYQFRVWNAFSLNIYYLIQGLLIITWVIENLFYSILWSFNSYASLFSYFLIVFISIKYLAKKVLAANRVDYNLVIFLLCFGFVFKYIAGILIEVFWIYGLKSSDVFLLSVYRLNTFVNLVVNILFAVCVLLIPPKREYEWLSK